MDFRAIKGAVSLKPGVEKMLDKGNQYFRAIKGAVSLKHYSYGLRSLYNIEFPRHQRRGLIEAKRWHGG